MSKNLKIVLIVFGCLFLVCSGIAGAGIYWFSQNGKQMMKDLAQGMDKSVDEGRTFGRGKDDTVCLKETLNRLDRDGSFSNRVKQTVFMQGCLAVSKRTEQLCSGVPEEAEFIKSSKWAGQKCRELGDNNQICGQLMSEVQKHCRADLAPPPPPPPVKEPN